MLLISNIYIATNSLPKNRETREKKKKTIYIESINIFILKELQILLNYIISKQQAKTDKRISLSISDLPFIHYKIINFIPDFFFFFFHL